MATRGETGRRGRRGGPRSYAAGWLAWSAALFVLWLLLTGTLLTAEVVAGLVASALGAAAAELVRSQDLVRFSPRLNWLVRAYKLPGAVTRDSGLLLAALARRVLLHRPVTGAFRAIPFEFGGEDARSEARRALITASVTFSPNTYVVGFDPDNDLVLVHQLVPVPRPRAARDLNDRL